MVQITTYLVIIFLALSTSQGKANEVLNFQGPPVDPVPIEVYFVLSARELPSTELFSVVDLPDAYVNAVYYRSQGPHSDTEKTEVVDNSHNPEWKKVFAVTFIEGQRQMFKFTVMDYDVVNSDETIGTVEVSLKDIVNSHIKAPKCRLIRPIVGKTTEMGELIIDCLINRKVNDDTVLRLRSQHGLRPTHFGTSVKVPI